jgi:hypothetical protein
MRLEAEFVITQPKCIVNGLITVQDAPNSPSILLCTSWALLE